jgi:hypothetical protein
LPSDVCESAINALLSTGFLRLSDTGRFLLAATFSLTEPGVL